MLQLKLDRMSENDNKSYKALQLMKAEVDYLNKEEPKKVLLYVRMNAPLIDTTAWSRRWPLLPTCIHPSRSRPTSARCVPPRRARAPVIVVIVTDHCTRRRIIG